ncbi:MAG: hypothetical protein ACRD32_06895, partial [Nitrososphaerales archaeon]
MQNSKHAFSGLIFSVLAFMLLTTTTNLSLAGDVYAQQTTLSVSAKDTGGKFFGPQIVEIVVEGPGIRNPDTNPGSVLVNGANVPLVHLSDGRWYAFFADSNTFTALAGAAGFPGS